MAGSNQESYWRIYLLLQEGCPLIFKQLVAREIEKYGGDIDSLLFDNKAKLSESLCLLDVDILFPESQKTDVDNWNAGIFPCVILTLFSRTLQQVEKQGIKRIKNVQDDMEETPAMSLDYDAYDDLEQTLSKTLHKLAVVSNETELVPKIDELLKVFLKQPLNVVDLLDKIRTFNMPNKTRQRLRVFLEAHAKKEHTSEITSESQTSVKEEQASLNEYGFSRKSANDSVEMQIGLEETGVLEEVVRAHDMNEKTDTIVDMIYERTPDVHTSVQKEEGSRDEYGPSQKSVNIAVEAHLDLDKTGKLEEAAKGSDEIGFDSKDVTTHENDIHTKGKGQYVDKVDGGSELYVVDDRHKVDTIHRSSDCVTEDPGELSIASDDDATNGSDEIINEAAKGMTEDDRNKCTVQWDSIEIEKSLKDKDFTSLTKRKLENWKNERVKVAVLGRTGVGKSRFINAIRGCTSPTDSDYAPIGSVETTSKPKAYHHPKNKLLQLWDLPGIGTETFPRKEYIGNKEINFYSYDTYIIMASDRFTEDEVYFAEKLDTFGKVFIFVRTRVDINLDGVDDIEAEVNKIRKDCEKIVSKSTVKSKDVFLISCKLVDHRYLDFGKLIERLVESLSGLKKEAVMYSLHFNTAKFINDKSDMLESRLAFTGLMSAGGGVLPVPGASLAVDYLLISSEIECFRKTLGITDNDLQLLAAKTGKSSDDLKREYKLKTFGIFRISTRDVTKLGMQFAPYLKPIAVSEALESTVKLLLPIVGSALGGGLSFATTYCFLRSSLTLMVKDARTMMDILLKETGSEVLSIDNDEHSSEGNRQ